MLTLLIATPSSLASLNSRLVYPFWCRLTHFVLEKRPLAGCLSCHAYTAVESLVIHWPCSCSFFNHRPTSEEINVVDMALNLRPQYALLTSSALCFRLKRKGKEEYLYSTFLHQGTHKALAHGSHSFTYKQHHACLSFVSVHQMAPPQQLWQQTSSCSLLLIYQP